MKFNVKNNVENKEIIFFPSKLTFWLWNIVTFVFGFLASIVLLYFDIEDLFNINHINILDFLWTFLLSLYLICNTIVYLKTPFLYYNKFQGYLKIKDRIIPISDVTAYKEKDFDWKDLLRFNFYFRHEYELILKNKDSIPFYGFYKGCDEKVRIELHKIGINRYD